jgi:hypothetical protein
MQAAPEFGGLKMSDPQVAEMLRQGIAAAQAGNNSQAEQLLRRVIAADRNNELAWLMMSSVVDDAADMVLCLENVLVINPNNEEARMMLAIAKRTANPPRAGAQPSSPGLKPQPSSPGLTPMASEPGMAPPEGTAPGQPAAQMPTPLPMNRGGPPGAAAAGGGGAVSAPTPIPFPAPPTHLGRDTINCERCGYGNWKGNRSCVRCGAELPVPVESIVQTTDAASGTVPKLGEYLVKYGFITQDQLAQALRRQTELQGKNNPKKLGEVLLEIKAISPQRLEYAIRQQQRDFYSAFND